MSSSESEFVVFPFVITLTSKRRVLWSTVIAVNSLLAFQSRISLIPVVVRRLRWFVFILFFTYLWASELSTAVDAVAMHKPKQIVEGKKSSR